MNDVNPEPIKFRRLNSDAYATEIPSSDPTRPPYCVTIERAEHLAGALIYTCECAHYVHRHESPGYLPCRHINLVRDYLVSR